MRPAIALVLCLLSGVTAVAGCGPAIPPEELGTVLEEVPEGPRPEEPQATPEPATAGKADSQAGGADAPSRPGPGDAGP